MIALLPDISIEELRTARLHEELTVPQMAAKYGTTANQMDGILRRLGIKPSLEQKRRTAQANARKCRSGRQIQPPTRTPPSPPPPRVGAGRDILALTQEALARGWVPTRCETVYAWTVTGAHLTTPQREKS